MINQFNHDLEIGKKEEESVDKILEGRASVEVKHDRKAQETGNLAFEIRNNDGTPSGLSITTAEYWSQGIGERPYARLIVEVPVLRRALRCANKKKQLKLRRSVEGATNLIISICDLMVCLKEAA